MMGRIGLLILLLLTGCATLSGLQQKPEVSLAGLELREAGLLEQQWTLRLRVQNPNDTELPIDGLSFAIELNGQPFARGVANRAVTIPSFGEGVVDVTATSTLGSFARQYREFRKGERKLIEYRVSGTLQSGQFGQIPFERLGEVDLFLDEIMGGGRI